VLELKRLHEYQGEPKLDRLTPAGQRQNDVGFVQDAA